jgi:uncharacterized membrane protein YhhN
MNISFPRLPGDKSFLLLVAVTTVALTVLRTLSMDTVTRWWIPAFEVAVLLRATLPVRPWSHSRTHLISALGFCLLGDVLINWTPWGDGCIVFFAITHLNLLWIFVHLRRPRWAELPTFLPGLLVSTVVLVAVLPNLSKVWMPWVLGVYLLLLDAMLWRALSLLPSPRPGGGRLLAAGALLFFATDHLVVLQIFRPATVWVVATWICYPPALALLALSARFLGGRGQAGLDRVR